MEKKIVTPSIEKLRPELLEKSDAELDRLITELQMAKDHKAKEAKRQAVEGIVAEANQHIDFIIEGLRFLEGNHLLNEDIKVAHSTSGGVFAPHLKYKAVDADRVIARQDEAKEKANGTVKVKKTRQPRTPKA